MGEVWSKAVKCTAFYSPLARYVRRIKTKVSGVKSRTLKYKRFESMLGIKSIEMFFLFPSRLLFK